MTGEPIGEETLLESQHEFRQLMQRMREGSEEAARELFERYGPHIQRVVRRRLSPKPRSKFDSSDFTQAVWASFFAVPAHTRRFERPEALVAFLVAMARHKVLETSPKRW